MALRESEEIRSLNTLRGIAALVVTAYHAGGMFGVRHWIPHGYLAVDLFFVISGFIMAHVYQARIGEGLGFRLFMRRRMARLYPLYAAATVAGAALYLWRVSEGLSPLKSELLPVFGLNLLLLPGDTTGVLANKAAYPFALQSWSIIWEIALSALFFVWAKWGGRRAALIAAGAAMVLVWAAIERRTLDGGFSLATFWVGGVRAAFGFAAGAAVFALIKRGEKVWAVLSGVGAVLGLLMVWYVFTVRSTWWAADLAIAVVVFPLTVALLARLRPRFAEHAVGDFLGEASYSIYLLHGLAMGLATFWLLDNPYMAQPWRFMFGCTWMCALLAASWLCWRYFETPMRKALSGGRKRQERMAFNAAA